MGKIKKVVGLLVIAWAALFVILSGVAYFWPTEDGAPRMTGEGRAAARKSAEAERIAERERWREQRDAQEKAERVQLEAESRRRSREIDALTACQTLIKNAASYKVVKRPGYVENSAAGDEFMFNWPRGEIVLQNGFGAEVPTRAHCLGNWEACEISILTVNGDALVSNSLAYPCG